jgi:putative transcriptional regulator
LKNRVKELRKKYGLTQTQLAKITGVSKQTIISIENDRYNPSIFLAYKIAKTFGLTIEEVFIFNDEFE